MELALELINWWRSQPVPTDTDGPPPLEIAKDLRDLKRPPKSRARIIKLRPWKNIVGITLHQTATKDFTANHPKLDTVPAHAMVHRDGTVSLLHHPTAYVYHGDALNAGTIGIEIACRASGVEGSAADFWRSEREIKGWHEEHGTWPEYIGRHAEHPGRWHPPRGYHELVAEATDVQLAAARDLVRYYVDLVADHGGEVRGIWAHRQGDKSRTTDPGERIWRAVAEPLRVELGLGDVRDLKLGTGTPVPKEWRA